MTTLIKIIENLIEKMFDWMFDHADAVDNDMRIKLNQMWRKEKERRQEDD